MSPKKGKKMKREKKHNKHCGNLVPRRKKKKRINPNLPPEHFAHPQKAAPHPLVKSRRHGAIQRKLQIKNQANQIKSNRDTENEETSEK